MCVCVLSICLCVLISCTRVLRNSAVLLHGKRSTETLLSSANMSQQLVQLFLLVIPLGSLNFLRLDSLAKCVCVCVCVCVCELKQLASTTTAATAGTQAERDVLLPII